MNVTRGLPVVPATRRSWAPAAIALVVLAGAIIAIGAVVSSYNGLVKLDQSVQAQWAQVENAYQRRADLVPSLVETVKGAANFEKGTLTAVTEARTRAQQAPPGRTPAPGELEQYQAAQDQLTSALSRLMVVVEAYPQLRATENFRDLQAQLEGTENRIATERMRFNQAAQDFNTTRNSFPTTVIAGMFGARFQEKAFFHARPEAQQPPKVQF
ncbi:MAG: LemA family protein [Archangiaceae bacterium]|nr:LemA family protein [Archangiaceae bacterium]